MLDGIAIFAPAAPQSQAVASYFLGILAIAGLVFLLVSGILTTAIVRFRNRPAEQAAQFTSNRRLEIAWTAAPALVLTGVYLASLGLYPTIEPPPEPRLTITAVGHQWWWEFRYDDFGFVTANELHLPAGEPVRIRLLSDDVIHSFWIPRLNGKREMIPGHVNEIVIEASEPSVYFGNCGEFCGPQHAWMLIRVVAEPRPAFNAWVTRQQQPAQITGERELLGFRVFQRETCGVCHAVQGTGLNGGAGPDLTHFGIRNIIGAGVLPNTPENLRRFILNAQEVKPGVRMPSFRLSDAEVDALVVFLESLD